MSRMRVAVTLLASAALLGAGGGQALASHGGGGGGGGGGGTPPPPAGAPLVTLTPSTVAYGSRAVGTTSTAQTVSVANTGNASLFVNGLGQGGPDLLDFAQVDDQCSGVTIPAGFLLDLGG